MQRLALAFVLALSFATPSLASTWWWHGGIPSDAAQQVGQLADADETVKRVAFAPNGGWVVFYGFNGYVAGNLPNGSFEAIEAAANLDQELHTITFAPNGGWVLVYGNNQVRTYDVPYALKGRLDWLQQQGDVIRDVAFTPANGWVIVGDGFSWYQNIPTGLAQKIDTLVQEGANFQAVSISPVGDKSILLWNGNKYRFWNFDNAAAQKLDQFFNEGRTLHAYGFAQDGNWIGIW